MAKDNSKVTTEKRNIQSKENFAPQQGTLINTLPAIRKLCIALIAITLLVYANTLRNGYVLDDMAVVEHNELVKSGISAIPKLLITPRFEGFEHIINDSYRPLSLVTFAIEYQLFGPNPVTGHLFNILFFAGCVVLLFLFLDKLFESKRTGITFIAALLFALHPIHTEVVANIKSRDELLCFFFAFWSLNIFAQYAKKGKPTQLVLGSVLLFLSYLSKETVIAFVLVLPLVFFFYLNNNKKRSVSISVATAIVTLAYLGIRAIVLRANNSGAIPFLDNPLVHAPFLATRLPTAILVLGIYLKLLFIPYPLVCDYSYNSIPFVSFANVTVLISLLAYIGIAVTGIYRLIKKPKDPLAFCILFFLFALALFSNIFFLTYSELAERLLFFASAGFCLGIAVLLWQLLIRQPQQNESIPNKLWLAVIPISLVFAVLTISRNADWKTNYSLTVGDVNKSPNNARLWHSMGYILFTEVAKDEPDAVTRQQIIKEGMSDMQRSLSIYPDNAKAHQDLGNFFRELQQYDSAEAQLKEAVRLNPTSFVPVSDLGYVYFCEKKYADAIALSKTALQKDKKNAGIINNIAMCYLQMQQYDSATIMIKQALIIDPENKQSNNYLGMINAATSKKNSSAK